MSPSGYKSAFWANYGNVIGVLGGIFLGCILGMVYKEKILVLEPVGNLFLNLLFTVVVPLVFFCIASAIANMDTSLNIGRISAVVAVVLIATVLISGLLTLGALWCWPIRQAPLLPGAPPVQITHQGIGDTLTQLFTVPEFYALLSRKSMLALILFSAGIGIATLQTKEKGAPFRAFLESGNEVMKHLLTLIMYLAPLGLGAYFACQVGRWGGSLLGTYGRAIILIHGVSLFYYGVLFSVYAFMAGGKKALQRYWKNNILPSATAIGTCSSIATIPVNLDSAKKMGIPPFIAHLVIPLGGPLHKEGSAISEIVKVFLMFSLFHQTLSGPAAIAAVLGISLLVSIVEGGIPNGGYIGEILTISVFGFPPAALPPIILVGTITDAVSTLVNATGDTVSAMLIARFTVGKKWMTSSRETIIV